MNDTIIAAAIGATVALAGSFGYFLPKVNELEDAVALRPPVLIVDKAKLAMDAVPMGSGKLAIDEHFRNTQSVIERFQDAGFLVLSRQHILSAPGDLMLRVEDLPENAFLQEGGDSE